MLFSPEQHVNISVQKEKRIISRLPVPHPPSLPLSPLVRSLLDLGLSEFILHQVSNIFVLAPSSLRKRRGESYSAPPLFLSLPSELGETPEVYFLYKMFLPYSHKTSNFWSYLNCLLPKADGMA
jgi:hypothetical protein